MPPRALLLDLDDTLLETTPAHEAAVSAAARRAAQGAGVSPQELEQTFHAVYRELEQALERPLERRPGVLLFRTRAWRQTLERHSLQPALAEELAACYRDERRRRYRLYPDALPFLAWARDLSLTLVLVTNGPSEFQREKIAAVALAPWFAHLLVSEEVGSWKPDPPIFSLALAAAGVEPHQALMIGDSLHHDIAGAAALGIPTAWVRRYPHLQPAGAIQPHHTVVDLATLAALLADAP